jgi:hypothetical protein
MQMKICNSCGVELDESLLICPLCGSDPDEEKSENSKVSNTPREIIDTHMKETANRLWELSGIIAFSAICVCTLVDMIVSKGLKWSPYVDTSCIAIWIFITLLHFKSVRLSIRAVALMLTILGMLIFFNLFAKESEWFMPVGLPMALSVYLCAGIDILFYIKLKFTGFNLLGISFFSIVLFMVLTEIILDLHKNGILALHWSLIAAVSIFPLCLVFFYVHYRLKRGNRLDSFFHV